MIDYLVNFAERLGHWGYFVIFLVVALECQAFLGLFMPGETLVLAGGFLAGQGVFDLDVLIVTVSIAQSLATPSAMNWDATLEGAGCRAQ